MDSGFSIFQTKPGPSIDITDQLENGEPWFSATEEVMLLRESNQLTVSFYKYGIFLIVRRLSTGGEYYINFDIQVPKTFARKTRGFLGNLDDNYNNDLHKRGDTTPLPSFADHHILEPLETCK